METTHESAARSLCGEAPPLLLGLLLGYAFCARRSRPGSQPRHPASWQAPCCSFFRATASRGRAGADSGEPRYTSAIWRTGPSSSVSDRSGQDFPALGRSRARKCSASRLRPIRPFVWVEAVHGLTLVQTEMRLVAEEGRRALAHKAGRHAAEGRFIPLAPAGPRRPRHSARAAGAEAAAASAAAGPRRRACAAERRTATRGLYSLRYRYFTIDRADIKDKDFAAVELFRDANCTVPGN